MAFPEEETRAWTRMCARRGQMAHLAVEIVQEHFSNPARHEVRGTPCRAQPTREGRGRRWRHSDTSEQVAQERQAEEN